MADATVDAERRVLPSGVVIGIDEVGRGALAGPVMVGAVALRVETCQNVAGLRDSKLLTARQRERLAPHLRTWCLAWGVGSASAEVIDAQGIMSALRAAAIEALHHMPRAFDLVILDGRVNWLASVVPGHVQVHCEIKADQTYASVAAASVLAKVARDAHMVELHGQAPEFGWDRNKGYGSREHRAAILRAGASPWHRRSWSLPSTATLFD